MQTDIVAIICGLGAGIGWGFSGFFDAKASKAIGPTVSSVLINCFVAAAYALIYLLFLARHHAIYASGVWYAIASGATITIGALSYFRGLAVGPVSLVSPLSASYPLVTTLLALGIFGARPTLVQCGGICMIMIGVMAASGLLTARGVGRRSLQKGPVLGLFTAVMWGAGYAFASQAISRLGWQLASLLEFSAMAIAFGVFVPLVKAEHKLTRSSLARGLKNKYILLSGSISLGAALALNIGLSREHSSGAIVSALSACYPVLTVILARRSFDETVAIIPLCGAFVSIAGVIILSLNF
ncbi:MAG: EamA family transporter [Candidatus Saccharibacteria bacterium]